MILGGGRETKESEIDLSVGLIIEKKVGDYVKEGDVLCVLHGNDEAKMKVARERFLNVYCFSETPPANSQLIKGIVKE